MTKKQSWKNFEERVRTVGRYIWGRPCEPDRIGGVNVDAVSRLDSEIYCLIEITEDATLGKVREDVIKLQTAKNAAYADGILARCFCVVNGNVTPAMKDAGKPHKIRVLSISEFNKQFFDFETYATARSKAPFGSSVNPLTGQVDETKYVPVGYRIDGKKDDVSSEELANLLRQGKNVILTGEYGSGKSRCIREIFNHMSGTAQDEFCYPIAIDLRRSWGLGAANEIIRRHFSELGLDEQEAHAIKAFRAKSLAVLLDGFDEIGSQAWSNDNNKLRQIRAKSLEGVKDIVVNNSGGTLIAGRDHYFQSTKEMLSVFGMKEHETIIARSKNEFNDEELSEYFFNREIEVDVPQWLPRRPLICQTIANLGTSQLEEIFGSGGNEVSFWNHFMDVLCVRDANINVAFDAQTIFSILTHLARMTRGKQANVGPISLAELQAAFEITTGAAPAEEASVMLQRLPSLGRIGPESNDRQFVDMYILDGLRAKDIANINLLNEQSLAEVCSAKWTNPLEDLGQRILSIDNQSTEKSRLLIARKSSEAGNRILASDIVASLMRENSKEIDFEDLSIEYGEFRTLAFDERTIRNIEISKSTIDEIAMPIKGCTSVRLTDCIAMRVTGISAHSALPDWAKNIDVGSFDSVASISRIRKIGLSPAQEIFVTILRKTFFQKGSGRKEEALLRGLGKVATKSLATKILNILIRNDILSCIKGNEGNVYIPNRSHKGRMQEIIDNLTSSNDAIWNEISAL